MFNLKYLLCLSDKIQQVGAESTLEKEKLPDKFSFNH